MAPHRVGSSQCPEAGLCGFGFARRRTPRMLRLYALLRKPLIDISSAGRMLVPYAADEILPRWSVDDINYCFSIVYSHHSEGRTIASRTQEQATNGKRRLPGALPSRLQFRDGEVA